MATYNTFIVQQTRNGRAELVTSSARKAEQMLRPGLRIEVWSRNEKTETIYTKSRSRMLPYITAEKEYIRAKQAAATERNQRRRRY